MKMGDETAGICGIFCGTCPHYPDSCEGCLSEKVAADCASCNNGFRDCVEKQGVTRCYECKEFPCQRLEEFSAKHVVNGIGHHWGVIQDLKEMGQGGVSAWVGKKQAESTCKTCGHTILWYHRECQTCGK